MTTLSEMGTKLGALFTMYANVSMVATCSDRGKFLKDLAKIKRLIEGVRLIRSSLRQFAFSEASSP